MKKLISVALCLCLLMVSFPAAVRMEGGEAGDQTTDAVGYRFDFSIRLHPEALSKDILEQAQGYADLFEAVRFHGTYATTTDGEFELNTSIIPLDSRGKPISFQLYGTEEVYNISSFLLGEETIRLNNYSLLGFCVKMSNYLGIPLHYLALLFPYSWKFGMKIPVEDWEYTLEHIDENGNLTGEDVWFLSDCWLWRIRANAPVGILLDALCKDSDQEEAFRSLMAELPDYIYKQVAKEQGIHIRQEGDTTIWHCASGDFLTDTRNDHTWQVALNLPRMSMGYLPVFSLEQDIEENSQGWRLRAQLLGSDQLQEDLVNLEATLLNFPVSWPAKNDSLLSFNLTGGLFPNLGISIYLTGEENGYTRLEFRKPTVNYEPGPIMLTVEGDVSLLEENVTVRTYDPDNSEGSLDLLNANDVTIREFLPKIAEPMVMGLVRFLVGIPASSCQAIMDDLMNMSLMDLLQGQ